MLHIVCPEACLTGTPPEDSNFPLRHSISVRVRPDVGCAAGSRIARLAHNKLRKDRGGTHRAAVRGRPLKAMGVGLFLKEA